MIDLQIHTKYKEGGHKNAGLTETLFQHSRRGTYARIYGEIKLVSKANLRYRRYNTENTRAALRQEVICDLIYRSF